MSSSPAFDEFVRAVHRRDPFPWQCRMASELVAGHPPQLITVPTGLGKTSVLDAWVWALATQADRSSDRTVPTRAAFIVDRRVIVDAAHEHARALLAALSSGEHPAASWAFDRLRSLGHDLAHPIEIVRMRGGVSWSWRWLRQPDQPAVVVGTVDQFGSRFLFRGYGVGDRVRSIDAALTGSDVIVFVDEAHLSGALGQTVRACAELEANAPKRVAPRPALFTAMSATPPIDRWDGARELTIGEADLNHAAARARLAAVKAAELVDLPEVSKAKATDSLAREVAERARGLAAGGKVVAVVVNTIDAARRTFDLVATTAKGQPAVDAVLAIGRCREVDREASRRLWWDRAKAGRARQGDAPGLVLVATQTIEVGADLDVDALITEIAPIDALIQRFGRVDRLGEVGSTQSWILRQPNRSAESANHVYGAAADRTWSWLEEMAGFGAVDFGSNAMATLLQSLTEDDRRGLLAPTHSVPEIYGEVLHQLARTNPAPAPDHPVATYLHGIQRSQPSVSVVWRAGVDSVERAKLLLTSLPPTTSEGVEVPLAHFSRFLRSEPEADTASDLEVVADPESIESHARQHRSDQPFPITAFRVRGDEASAVTSHRDLDPGDIVVVDAGVGGHDEFGWTGRADGIPVADVADLVRVAPPQLRLDRKVLESLLGPLEGADLSAGDPPALADLLTEVDDLIRSEFGDPDAGTRDETDLDVLVGSVLHRMKVESEARPLGVELRDVIDRLGGGSWSIVPAERVPANRGRSVVAVDDLLIDESGRVTFSGARLVGPAESASLDRVDDSEAGSSLIAEEVRLDTHLRAVGERAAAYALNIGLAVELVESVRLAGRAHDLGKSDARFQTLLRGGDWLAAAAFEGDPTRALAKSRPADRSRVSGADGRWQWPVGMRHEAISVALVRAAALPDDVDPELVEHLVASHHGRSRPLFPAVLDPHPRKVDASFEGSVVRASSDEVLVDWAQPARFRRLCERYGWWGLALLEAVLRLADIAISEEGT